jgi:hypothetical protein
MVFKIDSSEKFLLMGIYPKTVSFQDSTQKVNKDGVPLWSIRVFSAQNGHIFLVTVPSEKRPTFEDAEKIKFVNLAVNVSKKDNLNLVWFTAESVEKDGQ